MSTWPMVNSGSDSVKEKRLLADNRKTKQSTAKLLRLISLCLPPLSAMEHQGFKNVLTV